MCTLGGRMHLLEARSNADQPDDNFILGAVGCFPQFRWGLGRARGVGCDRVAVDLEQAFAVGRRPMVFIERVPRSPAQ